MATRTEFATAYRAELVARYPWAQDPARLEAAMAAVANTLDEKPGQKWSNSGPAYEAALAACGLPKRIPLKALRALPA